MKNRKFGRLNLVVSILLILALPILFFQLLGVDMLDTKGVNKRVIAIVNEDLGQAKDEENVEMGKEVVSILAEDSPYEWKVMGRGAAVNGLKSNQYEAIVYIPSDFTESILSYDQQNPKKAEFAYQVQRQKTGSRKEKVLNEIQQATNRVNEKIATLYWSYVAQEMHHIKKEFKQIVGAETDFLEAMITYYQPGSETLAANMQRQKEQLEGLRASIGNADQAHGTRIESTSAFGQQMNDFITYVQQYKAFQQQQKEILQQIQADSLGKIHAAAAKQAERFNESVQALEAGNEKLNQEIRKVNEKIDANKEKFEALSDLRKSEVDRQMKDLLTVQSKAIDRYNDAILQNLEKALKNGNNGSAAGSSMTPPDDEQLRALQEAMERIALAKQQSALPYSENVQPGLTRLSTAFTELKEKIRAMDAESPMLADIDKLTAELQAVQTAVSDERTVVNGAFQADVQDYTDASKAYGNLYTTYKTLYGENESVRRLLETYPADTARILYEIKQKEATVMQHPALTAEQRNRLETLFRSGPSQVDTESLLSYYATLLQYEFTLNERGQGAHRDELLKDEILTALLKNVVELKESELQGWASVGENIPEAQLGMTQLGSTFAAMMSGYKETVEGQHAAYVTELNAMDQQANLLLTQLQTPTTMLATGEPAPTTTEEQVAAGQQNIVHQLLALSDTVKSLSERQNGITNYANDLYMKAYDLKETSGTFSDKWGQNIEAMSAFNEDVQQFLSNLYVDGQENGYAFQHFVNPLHVKGEASAKEEVKKVPPVILYIIILVSSLLIGLLGHYLQATEGLRIGMTALLSLLVGLLISLYSINMYVLHDLRAIEWTLFTILLVMAGAALIHAALDFHPVAGWMAGIALMCLFISPLLILGVPEISLPDILSTVYMSIKYEAETKFGIGAVTVGAIAIAMLILIFGMGKLKSRTTPIGEEAYETE